jgi:hypothetical protein
MCRLKANPILEILWIDRAADAVKLIAKSPGREHVRLLYKSLIVYRVFCTIRSWFFSEVWVWTVVNFAVMPASRCWQPIRILTWHVWRLLGAVFTSEFSMVNNGYPARTPAAMLQTWSLCMFVCCLEAFIRMVYPPLWGQYCYVQVGNDLDSTWCIIQVILIGLYLMI